MTPATTIWLGAFVTALALLGFGLRVGTRVNDLRTQMTVLTGMGQPGTGTDMLRVRAAVKAIRFDLTDLRDDLGWTFPLLPWLRWIPEWGGDLAQAEPLLQCASDLASAADSLLDGLASLGEGDPATPILERSLEPLEQNREQFARARAYLARAEAARSTLDVAMLSARTASLVRQMDRALPLAQLAADGALVAPELLGAGGVRRYLIVAQNEDELRATGGFVSAAGLLTIERGRIVELSFMDSYQVDDLDKEYPPPPDALERIMRAGMLLFRDANWSPDFAVSARLLADLYEAGQGQTVDGVIALDQEAVRLLVKPVAPLEIAGNPPTVVTGENLLGFMRDSWAPPSGATANAAWLARKGFVGNLAQAFMQRVSGGGPVNGTVLAKGLYDALQSRRISVWLKESPLANSLAGTGWDGVVRAGDGDFLMVVNSNVGFNKANAMVAERYLLEATLTPELATQSRLNITYRHAGRESNTPCLHRVPDYGPTLTYGALMDLCYWDYLRVLVPKGSALRQATRYPIPGAQLLSREDSSGDPEVLSGDPQTDAFATFFYVERGGTRDVTFAYDPPPGAISELPNGTWRYLLKWQKQAGTPATPASLRIALPPSAVLMDVSTTTDAQISRSTANGAAIATLEFQMTSDMTVRVTFRRQ